MRLITKTIPIIFVLSFCFDVLADSEKGDSLSPGLRMQVEDQYIQLPLIETKIRGSVEGFVAKIDVTQTFVNPYNDFIEATYVFPLPESAAVNSMIMRLSNKDVVAKIKRREEAQQIYEKAVAAGKTAALLDQERPNIFTQKVGNIPPGEKIEVEISYVEALSYQKGVSSFVFPTVVGPRYIPGQPLEGIDLEPGGRISDTTSVEDASRITPPSFDEGEFGAHRIDLEISINPGLPIINVSSPSHRLIVDRVSKEKAIVQIAYSDNIPNKDFILKTDLRSDRPKTAVLSHRVDDEDGYVTVAIQPPALPKQSEIAPKDLFFVVDNSGSMSGPPLDAAKALIIEALKHMNKEDRFTIMRFSDDVSALSQTPLKNTPENVSQGIGFTKAMHGMGGTEMLSGIKRAIEGETKQGRVRIVFFLTDGYIGNDDEILAAVKTQNTSRARLFSLGVGSSVNRYLLSSMARLGRGEMQVMGYDDNIGPFVKRFYDRVRNPVLTDVSLKWNGVEISEQSPAKLPDLFDGQPLVVHARYETFGKGNLTIKGRLGKQKWTETINIDLPEKAFRPAVANLWARAKIKEWNDEETVRPGSHRDEIITVALTHKLMSQYTSFVAVDEEISRPSELPLIPMAQRLPLPNGVSRRALGSLSRYEIPPGDPFISVWAPANAKRVTAIFPFGLIKALTYDETRDKWRGRFLVPAGIPDGYYNIIIGIETKEGQLQYRRENYHLDSEAEEFITNFEHRRVRAGKGLLLEVDTIEKASEVYVHCEELGLNRVLLIAEDNQKRINWSKWIKIEKDIQAGTYTILVVMRDAAGNRLEKELTIEVYEETE